MFLPKSWLTACDLPHDKPVNPDTVVKSPPFNGFETFFSTVEKIDVRDF